LHYIQILCHSRFCKADDVYLTYLMLQRQLIHLNVRNHDLRRSLSLLYFLHMASHCPMFILMILYDFYSLGCDRIENTTFNSSYIVARVSVARICVESLPSGVQFLMPPLFQPFIGHILNYRSRNGSKYYPRPLLYEVRKSVEGELSGSVHIYI
jgi:hypothetical protein